MKRSTVGIVSIIKYSVNIKKKKQTYWMNVQMSNHQEANSISLFILKLLFLIMVISVYV